MKKETKRNVGAFRVALLLTAYAALTLIGTSRAVHAQTATPTPTPAWTQIGVNISNTNSGNVGIGTAAPPHRLTIDNSVDNDTVANLRLRSLTTRYRSDFVMGSTNGLGINSYDDIASTYLPITIDASKTILGMKGNVGIGTNTPSDILHVRKDQNAPTQIRVKNGTAGNAANTDIILENDAGDLTALSQRASATTPYGALAYRASYIYTNSPAGFAIMSDNPAGPVIFTAGGNAEKMRVAANGNVGIGTNNPQAKLDVVGNINVTGNINAKYQDIAEWVPSRQKLSAGTVVILDPDKSNQVIASSELYDTRVAGVISDQPGLLLGEGGDGKVKVATTGRVRVRVDASRGPIRIGDLLVTSGREGVAMKSEPIVIQGRKIHAPGTIIGKALESFEGSSGEIQVLLSLQ